MRLFFDESLGLDLRQLGLIQCPLPFVEWVQIDGVLIDVLDLEQSPYVGLPHLRFESPSQPC